MRKTALSLAASEAGIEYIHIRALGDPKEGRDAARAGMITRFRKIFSEVLAADPAQEALVEVGGFKQVEFTNTLPGAGFGALLDRHRGAGTS